MSASINFGRMRLISPDVPTRVEPILVSVEDNHDAEVGFAGAVAEFVDSRLHDYRVEHELILEVALKIFSDDRSDTFKAFLFCHLVPSPLLCRSVRATAGWACGFVYDAPESAGSPW